MDADEYHQWFIFDQIEPFGDRRLDYIAGLICSTIANTTRTKKSDKVWKISDFMPEWDKPEVKPQTEEDHLNIMLFLQSVQNSIQ